MAMPKPSAEKVLLLVPFHSFNTIPHMLLQMTFNDIRMLQEKAIITLSVSKKLLPIPNAKNCEYHKMPANAQNRMLLTINLEGVVNTCVNV